MAIAQAYTAKFSYRSTNYHGRSEEKIYRDSLYDFLYEHDYQAWFCNASKKYFDVRSLKEWFLRIHTGETLVKATSDWPWDKRQALGQQYLRNLARDFLAFCEANRHDGWVAERYKRQYEELFRRLEIDGYIFRDGELYQPEADVLDVEEEGGLLEKLHFSLGLPDKSTTFEFLKLSEDHYVAGRWSDCIANSRKFFEAILQQVCALLAKLKGVTISEQKLERPVEVRNFLETQGLLERKEREAVEKIYGLLSHTGSHPYMAEKDQARLLRQISLTITQFVMLRMEGAVHNSSQT
jgi:hypothetical protein